MTLAALVADGYDEHQKTLVLTLQQYGVVTIGSEYGWSTLEFFATHKPHLLICGYGGNSAMRDGWTPWVIAQKVLGEHAVARPYMVLLDGFPDKRKRVLSYEFGYDEYVGKPIELSALLVWVHRARERAESEAAKKEQGSK